MLSVYRSKLLAIRLKRDMHTKNYTRLCREEASYPLSSKGITVGACECIQHTLHGGLYQLIHIFGSGFLQSQKPAKKTGLVLCTAEHKHG